MSQGPYPRRCTLLHLPHTAKNSQPAYPLTNDHFHPCSITKLHKSHRSAIQTPFDKFWSSLFGAVRSCLSKRVFVVPRLDLSFGAFHARAQRRRGARTIVRLALSASQHRKPSSSLVTHDRKLNVPCRQKRQRCTPNQTQTVPKL